MTTTSAVLYALRAGSPSSETSAASMARSRDEASRGVKADQAKAVQYAAVLDLRVQRVLCPSVLESSKQSRAGKAPRSRG